MSDLTERVATLEANEASNALLLRELRRDVKGLWWKFSFLAGGLATLGSLIAVRLGV